jgi:ubiquinone/menaquinone biosynthesis C-methylase UbiE
MSVSPTAGGFDALAPGYDDDFGSNPIGRWMRQRTWERMDALFAPDSHILEVGCGTGIDMMRLASQGHQVTAMDISPAMASMAREKAAAAGVGHRVTVLCGDLASGENPDLLDRDAHFDGLLSNFGALNCVRDISGLTRRLHGLLKPGAPFLACVMTRPCPWETAWHLLRLQPGEAFRRFRRDGVDVRLGEHAVRTYYKSAGGYGRLFSSCFHVDRLQGLGILVPPPYLQGLARRFPRFFGMTVRAETALAHRRPFCLAGDHTLIEMTAKECVR